jgi:hypothetical protein
MTEPRQYLKVIHGDYFHDIHLETMRTHTLYFDTVASGLDDQTNTFTFPSTLALSPAQLQFFLEVCEGTTILRIHEDVTKFMFPAQYFSHCNPVVFCYVSRHFTFTLFVSMRFMIDFLAFLPYYPPKAEIVAGLRYRLFNEMMTSVISKEEWKELANAKDTMVEFTQHCINRNAIIESRVTELENENEQLQDELEEQEP